MGSLKSNPATAILDRNSGMYVTRFCAEMSTRLRIWISWKSI